jgi:AcrR family transcriptional regulator
LTELSKAELKRQAREEELIDLAVDIVHEVGVVGLTLEKLTSRSSYSKGTIYNHFSSREDCIAGLCQRGIVSIIKLFEKAASFPGNLREKAIAVHFAYRLFARLEPALFMVILFSKAPGMRAKTSEQRSLLMEELESQINHFSDSMFQRAIDEGCIHNPLVSVETMSFANWAMSFGTNALACSASESIAVSRLDADAMLLDNINIVLDGLGWQPLSSEWNYQQTWQKLEQEYFAAELQQLSPQDNN